MILNEEQLQAVRTLSKKVLVIAGPGTGKTRVIIERIKWLVNHEDTSANSIMVMTFSNKAASELLDRLNADSLKLDWVGTFHSICFKILIIYGDFKDYKIIDDQDQNSIIAKLNLKNLTADKINSFKDKNLHLDNIDPDVDLYNKFLQDNKMFDFADIINHTISLLENNENIRAILQRKFLHIMIDEFQDTSTNQNIFIKLLSENSNLFCVGDDDQSIYGWRGANINNILEFNKDPQVTTYYLEKNYRSAEAIVKSAQYLISFNKNRISKRQRTFNENDVQDKILLAGTSQEYDFILSKINEIKSLNPDYNMAILVRTSALTHEIKNFLSAKGIYATIRGGINLFQRKEVKIFINYLRAIFLNDLWSFEYIINIPKRGIGPKKIEYIYDLYNNQEKTIVEILEVINPNLLQQWDLIKNFSYKTCDQLITYIKDLIFPKDFFNEDEINHINILINKAFYHSDINEFLNSIISFYGDSNSTVQIMTFHGSKGLEFDYVFLPHMIEGLFPNFKAIIDNPEEERRLAYVGLTRAKKGVILSYDLNNSLTSLKRNFGPSRFIYNIPQNLVRFVLFNSNN